MKTWNELRVFKPIPIMTADEEEEIIEDLRSTSWQALEAIDCFGNGSDWTEWEDMDDDLIELSRRNPEVVVELTTVFQSDNSRLRTYYHNGQWQLSAAKRGGVFAAYNPDQLIPFTNLS